jgi:carboxypeptidase family protein
MKRLILLLSLLALPAPAATISGTVVQSGTNTPLPFMMVQAYDASGALKSTTTTDAAGRYSLTLPAGTYRVLAFDPAGAFATNFYSDAESFDTSAQLPLTSTQTLTNINFALVRGGFVAGNVDSTAGVPLASITVAAYNLDGARRGFTATDAAGHYQLVLPPGTYKVAAYDDAQDYLTSFYAGQTSFVAGNSVGVTAAQTTAANFALVRASAISGMITDASTGSPIVGAAISIYSNAAIVASANSGASGQYRVLVPAGAYRVVLFDPTGTYAPLYYPNAESFNTTAVITLAEGQTQSGVNAQLVRSGRVTGQVTDLTNGAALVGITVAAYNADGTTRGFTVTDGSGNFTLVLPPGSYRIAAYDTSLVYLRRFYPNEIAFASAPAWSVFASQSSTLNFSLPRGGVVTGQVTTTLSAALAGITVSAYDASGVVALTSTDAAGNYRLLLEAGTYAIAAFDPAYRFATAYGSAGVSLGEIISNQNFALTLGVHISGTVFDPSGLPAGGMTVAAYDSNGNQVATGLTRGDGGYDLVVQPGKYRFAAYDPLQRFSPSSLTQSYTLTLGQVSAGITLQLGFVRSARHRAARH